MKFINKTIKELKIANDNNHLLDVFYPNSYLELGSINYDVIEKILDYKLVSIDDVSYFAIQNKGIGSSNVNEDELKKKLPYFYFENIHNKNIGRQLILTYGLIINKTKKHTEQFSPLILLPINLYFIDNNFYIQLISQPLENHVALNQLTKSPIMEMLNERYEHRLDNIYALDKYCLSYKERGYEVKLENYLTFALTLNPPLVLNHDIFDLKNQANHDLENTAYSLHGIELTNITPLNNRERLALLRALSGNSFGISGYLGTGKTTTLLNMAASLAYKGKKVLYLSEMNDTLKHVEKILTKKGLGHLVSNLTNPPTKVNPEIKEFDCNLNEFDTKRLLLSNYNKIKEYERILSDRIQNYRFIDALEEKLLQEQPKEDFVIDELKGYYKHEFLEIVQCLKRLEELRKKIPDIKKSLFVNIPIVHSIKYPNQIITLLFQIRRLFEELNENKLLLENKYGLKKILNYARFKNIITDIQTLELDKVPLCWRGDNLDNFNKALKTFPELKKEIYTIREYELTLEWNYNKIDIDIDSFIIDMYNDLFDETNHDKINDILKNNRDLYNALDYHNNAKMVLKKALDKIQKLISYRININDDKNIIELMKLNEFINNNNIKPKWADIVHYKDLRREINKVFNDINKYYEKENLYNQYFEKIKDTSSAIKYLEKIALSNKKPSKFNNVNIINLINEIKKYEKEKNTIDDLKTYYKELTDLNYTKEGDPLYNLDICYNYFMSIQNKDLQNALSKFFMKVPSYSVNDLSSALNDFSASIAIAINTYDYLLKFFPEPIALTYANKFKFNDKCYDYIIRLREINSIMLGVLKNSSNYVQMDEYTLLKKRLADLNNIKNSVKNNKKYAILYGNLFEEDETKVSDVNTIIRVFSNYIECFENITTLEESLEEERNKEINEVLDSSLNIINEISETFKIYCKIFKDGIGDYYYNDINKVVEYFDCLINAKEELITYLDITSNLQILMKYKLFKFNKLIIENQITDLVNLFRYKYFNTLYQNFINNNEEILATDDFLKTVSETINLEESLANIYAKKLQKPLTRSNDIVNRVDYKEYIQKTDNQKSIYLANTQILNNFLDAKDFDVILIDDAHLLNANVYYKAVQGKQVIVAGEEQQQMTMAASLITRLHKSDIMRFNYRYNSTPLELLKYADNLIGCFKNDVKKNNGFKIIREDVGHYIAGLLVFEPNVVINFLVKDLDKQKTLYEAIVQELVNYNLSNEKIYELLHTNLNVCDIYGGYLLDADYNMVFYDDYISGKTSLNPTITANLFLCKKKILIFDEANEVKSRSEKRIVSRFSSQFKSSMDDSFVHNYSNISLKVIEKLEKKGFEILGSYNDISMVLKRNNTYYGVILYGDPDKSHIDMLSFYRDYISNYKKNNFKIAVLSIIDLAQNFDLAIKKVVGELINE